MEKRRIVNFRVMRQHHIGRIAIGSKRLKCFVRPFRDQGYVRKALGGCERRSWVDNYDIVPELPRHWDQRLTNMHRTNRDDPDRRRLNRQKNLTSFGLDHAAPAHSQRIPQMGAERIV